MLKSQLTNCVCHNKLLLYEGYIYLEKFNMFLCTFSEGYILFLSLAVCYFTIECTVSDALYIQVTYIMKCLHLHNQYFKYIQFVICIYCVAH